LRNTRKHQTEKPGIEKKVGEKGVDYLTLNKKKTRTCGFRSSEDGVKTRSFARKLKKFPD